MPSFDSSGVQINYVVEGEGPEIVLVHGFTSSIDGNWRATRVIEALIGAGRRVVALDCRGHGRSGKPKDPAAYGETKMADDVIALMDHLGIARADLAGYSMGGFLSASLLARFPERFRSVIISGVGDTLVEARGGQERSEAMAQAMEAPDGGETADPIARGFRILAERTGNDLAAMAAMHRAPRSRLDTAQLAGVTCPVLVLLGEGDTLAGSAEKLVAAIAGATLVQVAGDHLTVLGNPAFRQAMVDFLAERSPVPAV